MIRPTFIYLLCSAALQAATVPAGTEIAVRLMTPLSSAKAKIADPVRVIAIAPVVISDMVALPAGTTIEGKVAAVKPATASTAAELDIRFTSPVVAHISAVDNARESVDAKGVVAGIVGAETFSGRLDQGLAKLQSNSRFAALAGIIQGAKETLKIQDADPEINFPEGTEFTLQVNKPFTWEVADKSPFSRLQPVPNPDALIALVNTQPFRTFAERPPRPSDLTNIMFIGSEAQLREAFEKAGWSTSAKLSSESKMETARAIIEARGYKEGPMSVLLLAGNPPDMVYQKGNNTYAQRHHLRIFRRPDTFDGQAVWVCSSTHDTGIDFSESDRTFIHKIDSNIDRERAKVVSDLVFTGLVAGIALVDRPAIPQNATNATGDALQTDGKMAVVQFQR